MSSPTLPNSRASSPSTVSAVDWNKATFLRTVLRNPWIRHRPTTRQALFLTNPCLEVLYGGAGGGGKSDALLAAAAQ